MRVTARNKRTKLERICLRDRCNCGLCLIYQCFNRVVVPGGGVNQVRFINDLQTLETLNETRPLFYRSKTLKKTLLNITEFLTITAFMATILASSIILEVVL